MRELVYYVATSVDGFIAHEDGTWDGFLESGDHLTDLFGRFPETLPGHIREQLGLGRAENQRFDAVLMGRRTYEVGLAVGVTCPYPTLEQHVFSSTLSTAPDPVVGLVSSDALGYVQTLKRAAGRDIWLCGGGALATALAPEIDRLILKVNPVLFGRGIPLFAGPIERIGLELTASQTYPNGFALQEYRRTTAPES